MTSSERHLRPDQSRWDFNVQRYKDDRDVFSEKGLLSIVVLAHGRPEHTHLAVSSTISCLQDYPGEIEWVFIENCDSDANMKFFRGLDLERKVIVCQSNYGINEALNQGWKLSRGEYVMIHENDWQAICNIDFVTPAKQIFEQEIDVGVIQLRDPHDPNENFGRGKPEYNPWSCTVEQVMEAGFHIYESQTSDGHSYFVSNHPNGFNNNPVIIRKSLYHACGSYPEALMGCDPRHGETEYQARVAYKGYETAYIGVPIYQHMGRIQTKAT